LVVGAGAGLGFDCPSDGVAFDSSFGASGTGRGLAFSRHGLTELWSRISGPAEGFVVVAFSDAAACSGTFRSSAVSTAVTRAKASAKAIRIKPTLRSGSLPNARLPPGNLTAASSYESQRIEVLRSEKPATARARPKTGRPSSGTPPVLGSGSLEVVLGITLC